MLDNNCRAWEFRQPVRHRWRVHADVRRRKPDANHSGERFPRCRSPVDPRLAEPTSKKDQRWTRFNDIFTEPQNEIFKVVFFPDRVYHAQYLNATRSPRYRYNVREVRNVIGIMVMKGRCIWTISS